MGTRHTEDSLALRAFLDAWDDEDLLLTVTPELGCAAATALAALFAEAGRFEAAVTVTETHTDTAAVGDRHTPPRLWLLPPPTHRRWWRR